MTGRKHMRRACLLLALLAGLSGALAEDAPAAAPAEPAPTEAPAPATAEPAPPLIETPAPSPEESASPGPTAAATPEPSATIPPEASPSTVPTAEISPEPSATPDPTAPTPEPSATIPPEASPSTDPTAEATPSPSATPAPSGALSLTAEGAQLSAEGVWQFSPERDETEIAFRWSALEGASSYAFEVLDGQGAAVQSGQTAECRLALSAQDCASSRFTLRVRALADGTALAEDSLRFECAQPGRPQGGRPSGGFSGGRPSGGASGGAREAAQGFHVTPGVALTASHASGTKDARLYGTVALAPPEEPVARLTLDGTELSVTLDDGASAFTAALRGDVLVLTPSDSGAVWTVNARALSILHRSGAAELVLCLDGAALSLPTGLEFRGAAYAALRTQGYVSGDFDLRVDADGVRVEAGGETWRLDESGELIAP